MERKRAAVKAPPKRRYDSSSRQAQAERSRVAVLDAAAQRFFAQGYASTTVAAIAADAGVSVETIYKAFGGKAGLVRAIHDRGLAGVGPVSAHERSDKMRVREKDARKILANWGALLTEVSPLVSPVVLLVRAAAASEPEMATLFDEIEQDRYERMTTNARFLRNAGYLRKGISLEQAADVLWTYNSADVYELLVVRRGWSVERYGAFVVDAMIAALLP